jgi:cytochrome c oxidase subunit 3
MPISDPAREPFATPEARSAAGLWGMWLFIIVIAMVFVATMLAYLVVRLGTGDESGWRPEGSPGLPRELILSTLLLAASSWTMQRSLVASRANHDDRAVTSAWATFALGWAFVAVQGLGWSQMWRALPLQDSLYAWTFYVLTALHALHVLGGLAAMYVVIMRVVRSHDHREAVLGLTKCTMYWHTLGAIWIALYATLWIGSFD